MEHFLGLLYSIIGMQIDKRRLAGIFTMPVAVQILLDEIVKSGDEILLLKNGLGGSIVVSRFMSTNECGKGGNIFLPLQE